MMHPRDREAKSESVKIQVGRRSSQQKEGLDALYASPDFFRKLHKEVLPREQQIHAVYPGKCVITTISDKVLRGTGQQWDEPSSSGWTEFCKQSEWRGEGKVCLEPGDWLAVGVA